MSEQLKCCQLYLPSLNCRLPSRLQTPPLTADQCHGGKRKSIQDAVLLCPMMMDVCTGRVSLVAISILSVLSSLPTRVPTRSEGKKWVFSDTNSGGGSHQPQFQNPPIKPFSLAFPLDLLPDPDQTAQTLSNCLNRQEDMQAGKPRAERER